MKLACFVIAVEKLGVRSEVYVHAEFFFSQYQVTLEGHITAMTGTRGIRH